LVGDSVGGAATAGNGPVAMRTGGAACPHRGGVEVSDTRDPAGSRRERGAQGMWTGLKRKRCGPSRKNKSIFDLFR
jgi:hypothetical protein